ncbi:hypothetical protein GCM10009411_19320 [Shewanella litoralis]|uniref:DUF4372 domain-containing protein n=1 Tax=Shewanella litoralis TaxID=2282700 RepID=A0ABQ2RAF0_9GAMM|nr:hypothetical protein GCM10009411_19320 [Shewanella litoralis]
MPVFQTLLNSVTDVIDVFGMLTRYRKSEGKTLNAYLITIKTIGLIELIISEADNLPISNTRVFD